MKFTVVKNGKYTGTTYDELNDKILAHHASQDEQVIPVEKPPEPILADDDMPVFGEVDFETFKLAKAWEIADKRWRTETSGIIVDGVEIATDRESQALLRGAVLAAQNNPQYKANWKAKNGWAVLDAATILAVADAVRPHVQACFDREKLLQEQIEAATTVAELEAVKWE
jgi:hypothetical protein